MTFPWCFSWNIIVISFCWGLIIEITWIWWWLWLICVLLSECVVRIQLSCRWLKIVSPWYFCWLIRHIRWRGSLIIEIAQVWGWFRNIRERWCWWWSFFTFIIIRVSTIRIKINSWLFVVASPLHLSGFKILIGWSGGFPIVIIYSWWWLWFVDIGISRHIVPIELSLGRFIEFSPGHRSRLVRTVRLSCWLPIKVAHVWWGFRNFVICACCWLSPVESDWRTFKWLSPNCGSWLVRSVRFSCLTVEEVTCWRGWFSCWFVTTSGFFEEIQWNCWLLEECAPRWSISRNFRIRVSWIERVLWGWLSEWRSTCITFFLW